MKQKPLTAKYVMSALKKDGDGSSQSRSNVTEAFDSCCEAGAAAAVPTAPMASTAAASHLTDESVGHKN